MRILDLFCGAGGCSVGYARAGFDVVGVDIDNHPDYPFPLVVADALEMLRDPSFVAGFSAIHASPPCQGFTTMSNRWRGKGGKADDHPDLISWTRVHLQAVGKPYVIENVPGARRELIDPITLTGGMFGLRVERPRLFESNVPLVATGRGARLPTRSASTAEVRTVAACSPAKTAASSAPPDRSRKARRLWASTGCPHGRT